MIPQFRGWMMSGLKVTLAKSGVDLMTWGHHTMFLGMLAQPDGSTGLRSMKADAGYRRQSILHLSSLLSILPTPPSQSVNRTLIKSCLWVTVLRLCQGCSSESRTQGQAGASSSHSQLKTPWAWLLWLKNAQPKEAREMVQWIQGLLSNKEDLSLDPQAWQQLPVTLVLGKQRPKDLWELQLPA